jgi:hypothetical protein
LDALDVPDKEADTKRLWEEIMAGTYGVVISDLTAREIDGCPEPKNLSNILSIAKTWVANRNLSK